MSMVFLLIGLLTLISVGFITGVIFLVQKLNGNREYIHNQQHSNNALLNRMNHEQQQQFDQSMHNPYTTPGLDAVVDRHYHGINNGLD